MSTSQAAAPRLLRAVADSTQPYGPLLEGKTVHTLQVLLSEAYGVLHTPARTPHLNAGVLGRSFTDRHSVSHSP